MQQLRRKDRWVWLNVAAVAWGAVLVVLACTVHDRGSAGDPAMIFHSYTLVQDVGPAILILVAAPLLISLVLARVLYLKTTRRSFRAERAAWWVASLSLLMCLPGLIVQGLWVLPAPVLVVAAAASAPLAARESLGVRD
ncbi:MAG TPA: hypothetical protein VHV28_08700 [Solirubrobacteraceae bacterium]|jgi:uncharacterized membrane protein (UPF0182 family)|nr:hypothetical protein [Solirubrobacteraceae bacterium]